MCPLSLILCIMPHMRREAPECRNHRAARTCVREVLMRMGVCGRIHAGNHATHPVAYLSPATHTNMFRVLCGAGQEDILSTYILVSAPINSPYYPRCTLTSMCGAGNVCSQSRQVPAHALTPSPKTTRCTKREGTAGHVKSIMNSLMWVFDCMRRLDTKMSSSDCHQCCCQQLSAGSP